MAVNLTGSPHFSVSSLISFQLGKIASKRTLSLSSLSNKGEWKENYSPIHPKINTIKWNTNGFKTDKGTSVRVFRSGISNT